MVESSELMALASVIASRLNLARQLGDHPTGYQGRRDFNLVLGYPDRPDIKTYWGWYLRDGIAARVVDKPAEDTWRKPPKVTEGDSANTPFVQAWDTLVDRLQVWATFTRFDRLAGIGRYGTLLLGIKDGKLLKEPLEEDSLQSQQSVLFLRPFSERSVGIDTFVSDNQSVRFGLPLIYSVDLDANNTNKLVHWSRIIHFADNRLDSNIVGVPRLQRLLNRLLDIMKVVGGGAEAAWQLMNTGKIVRPQAGYDIDWTDTAVVEQVNQELEKLAHDTFRWARLTGMEVQEIGPSQTPDIANQWSVLKEIVAITADIPQSVLFGSAAGELAAAKQDDKRWAGSIDSRQRATAEPLLRKFIDRLIWAGALPTPPRGYDIGTVKPGDDARSWPALFELDALDNADISQKQAAAANNLRNPITGATPLTRAEEREILGVPAQPEPELGPAMPVRELQAQQAAEVVMPTVGRDDADAALELYTDGLRKLIFDAQSGKITRDEFNDEMRELVGIAALTLFLASSGKTEDELTATDRAEIDNFDNVNLEALRGLSNDIYISNLFTDDEGDPLPLLLAARVSMWAIFALNLVNRAYVLADLAARYQWFLGATLKHCPDCLRLNGQVHTGQEWLDSGWLPQTRILACNGWNCDCRLSRTQKPTRGGF